MQAAIARPGGAPTCGILGALAAPGWPAQWLSRPISGTAAAHHVVPWVAWHGRLMALSWGLLLPLGILVARFFKVTPSQAWPAVLAEAKREAERQYPAHGRGKRRWHFRSPDARRIPLNGTEGG